jgi:hypothetical protein
MVKERREPPKGTLRWFGKLTTGGAQDRLRTPKRRKIKKALLVFNRI